MSAPSAWHPGVLLGLEWLNKSEWRSLPAAHISSVSRFDRMRALTLHARYLRGATLPLPLPDGRGVVPSREGWSCRHARHHHLRRVLAATLANIRGSFLQRCGQMPNATSIDATRTAERLLERRATQNREHARE